MWAWKHPYPNSTEQERRPPGEGRLYMLECPSELIGTEQQNLPLTLRLWAWGAAVRLVRHLLPIAPSQVKEQSPFPLNYDRAHRSVEQFGSQLRGKSAAEREWLMSAFHPSLAPRLLSHCGQGVLLTS